VEGNMAAVLVVLVRRGLLVKAEGYLRKQAASFEELLRTTIANEAARNQAP
jgi:hypothetical protein